MWWEFTRDLVIVCGVLAGYAWLTVLSRRVRVLSRRLGAHVCGDQNRGRAGGHSEAHGRVDATEILRRERDTPRPMLPPRRTPATTPAADMTQPIPVLGREDSDYDDEGYWR